MFFASPQRGHLFLSHFACLTIFETASAVRQQTGSSKATATNSFAMYFAVARLICLVKILIGRHTGFATASESKYGQRAA
jgi:hypothetical protein